MEKYLEHPRKRQRVEDTAVGETERVNEEVGETVCVNEAEVHISENEEEEDEVLQNSEVHAIVYAYCVPRGESSRSEKAPPYYDPDLHDTPVYVGQTIQDILVRDKQHRGGNTTPFDRQYTDRAQYTLVVLDSRTFAPAATPCAFRDDTLRPAAEWMDVKEQAFIARFDTYRNGWNSTAGGQGRGWLVIVREAIAKATLKRFETVYMPAFRDHYKEFKHVNAKRDHPVIGKLLNSVRTGNTAIPAKCEDELLQMGLDVRNQKIVERDRRWDNEYMPAFRDHYKEFKHVNAKRDHPVIGKLLNSVRTGNTAIPAKCEDELLQMGLDVRNQKIVERDRRWDNEYMPAFRDHYKEFKHVNAKRDHPVLGTLVNHIRTGNTAIPAKCEDELLQMGLDVRNQKIVERDRRWENEYMPAFRIHDKEFGHVNAKRDHPVLGTLVSHIRTGDTAIPAKCEDELRSKGLFWCTQNLARHVARMLGRTAVSLDDAEVRDAVAQAAAHHAKLLTLRSALTKDERRRAGLTMIPLGTKSIGDGIARFHADVTRLCASIATELSSRQRGTPH